MGTIRDYDPYKNHSVETRRTTKLRFEPNSELTKELRRFYSPEALEHMGADALFLYSKEDIERFYPDDEAELLDKKLLLQSRRELASEIA